MTKGKLVLTKKGAPQVEYTSKKGKLVRMNISEGECSQTIMDKLKEFEGKEVEFELVGGQPKKVREVEGEFVTPAQSMGKRTAGHRQERGRRSSSERNTTNRKQPDFHNPYNFVPSPPRKIDHPELGDHRPVSQDHFHTDRCSGWIRVRMEVKTPLIVIDPETEEVVGNGHKTFDVLTDPEDRPLVPVSSIRGMLRSAYEAVTNSRFGRFDTKHKKRLAFRMDAREGLKLIPARVEDGQIRLLTGTSKINSDGSPNGPQYAAWLPRYSGNNKNTGSAVKYSDGSLPKHGDEVWCWVEKIQHYRWDKENKTHKKDFQYWRVLKIYKSNDELESKPVSSSSAQQLNGKSWHEPIGETTEIHGWVCVTNVNINRKHDERVFFVDDSIDPPGPFEITEEYIKKWEELIGNYQEIHKDEIKERKRQGHEPDEYLGREPGRTAWSRHVYTEESLNLKDGTLLYVRLNNDHSQIEALFPVMIARELYQSSPWNLLHESLRPACSIDELSPADRVFGWVLTERRSSDQKTGEPTAVRGLLRVGPVRCQTPAADAIERFDAQDPNGLPLAILAQPKPQQGRFYVAKSSDGEAQADELCKQEVGYSPDKGLRGRKIYPHHARLPDNYWNEPLQDRTQQGPPWQEYRRPRKGEEEQRDSQNRSIKAWIKPGTEFVFDIHVLNLSKVELGALLWLLSLPEGHFHRFGGGKSLGFGSMRLDMGSCGLLTGDALRRKYTGWQPALDQNPKCSVDSFINAFKEAVVKAYNDVQAFEDVPFIKAFLRACRGFDDGKPVHYPRATADRMASPPSPDGESFKWFVANEKRGNRYALRELWNDPGLPTLEDSQVSGSRTRPRRR